MMSSTDAEEVAALSPLAAEVPSQHPYDAARLALQRNPLPPASTPSLEILQLNITALLTLP